MTCIEDNRESAAEVEVLLGQSFHTSRFATKRMLIMWTVNIPPLTSVGSATPPLPTAGGEAGIFFHSQAVQRVSLCPDLRGAAL
jgi:hypothetical protein